MLTTLKLWFIYHGRSYLHNFQWSANTNINAIGKQPPHQLQTGQNSVMRASDISENCTLRWKYTKLWLSLWFHFCYCWVKTYTTLNYSSWFMMLHYTYESVFFRPFILKSHTFAFFLVAAVPHFYAKMNVYSIEKFKEWRGRTKKNNAKAECISSTSIYKWR